MTHSMSSTGVALPMLSVGNSLPIWIPWLLLLVAIYKYLIYPVLISPLARIPNAHWSSSFSPLWILWVRYRFLENREIHAAHLELGKVIRLGPNEISVSCVDGGIRSIYGGGFEKGDWYSLFNNYGVPCMFSSWHSRPHSVRKRMISHVYSKSMIQTSPAFASQAIDILFGRLLPIISTSTHPSQDPKGIDVFELWNATTMDFITAYLFGLRHSSNFLKDVGYRQHWLELYQSRKKLTFFPQELPRITKIMHIIGIRLVPRWVDWANQEIEAWCAGLCKAATTVSKDKQSYNINPGDEPVVLNALLSGIEKEKKQKGSESVLRDTTLKEPELSVSSEMLDHLAAGHETSAITLTYLTWHLSQDIPLQKALRSELLTLDHPLIYSPSTSTNSSGRQQLKNFTLPCSKQLDTLPILHATIMETLRLKAPIPGNQPRISPHPSSTVGGYKIPGGVRVGSSAWSLHRNASVFPSPDTWDHTRWLDNGSSSSSSSSISDSDGPRGDEARRDRDKWFWAFSSGGRMCIGSNFAMQEMKLIAAAIYTNFTTHVVDDDGIEQMDGYTCGPRSNRLFLRFEKAVD